MRVAPAVLLAMLVSCSNETEPQAKPDPALFVRPPNDRPPMALVRLIEKRLEREPCVGRLADWTRVYGHPGRIFASRIDWSTVYIALTEAGRRGPAGLRIEGWEPPNPDGTHTLQLDGDDPEDNYRSASGTYDRAQCKILYWRCGTVRSTSTPDSTTLDVGCPVKPSDARP